MIENNALLSEAKMLFFKGEFDKALETSKKAIHESPKNEDAYLLAGQVALSLNDANAAAQYYNDLVRVNPRGDYFYLLGYAQTMNDDGMNAIINFEKALHLGCSAKYKGNIYKMMAMLNVEMGKFEDGLKNIENASAFIGLDLDLLKSRFLCYSGLEDYKNAVASCNQMKLISPSSYEAYSMSFEILMLLEIYEEAKNELMRAYKSVSPLPQQYYDDKVKYVILTKTKGEAENFTDEVMNEVLHVYSEALDNLYKTSLDCDNAFSIILRGAQTYLQKKDGRNALRLARLLWDIPSTIKRKESLLEYKEKTEEELEETYNTEFFNTLGTLTYDERSEEFEKVKERLTPLDAIAQSISKTDQENEFDITFKLNDDQKEIIWGIELSAYDLLNDYESELKTAQFLKKSQNINSSYLGKYSVLRCQKLLNSENWRKDYENAIVFWKEKRMMNPDDILALPYQIRCLIDLGSFEEAERLINKLPAHSGTMLTEILNEEKSWMR